MDTLKSKRQKKIVLIATGSMLFLTIIAVSILIAGNKPRNYVALGDSVSSGYGLNTQDDSYPSILFELLKEEGYVDEYRNFAVSGYTTTMLLEQLDTLDKEDLRFLRYTRIITLNIGGNNILTPFTEYLSELQVVSGASDVKSGASQLLSGAWGVLSGIISGIGGLFFESGSDVTVSDVIGSAGDILTGVGDILGGAGGIISGTPRAFSTFAGSFSPELEEKLGDGIQTFNDEFIEIIKWLQKRAPKATIIVNTVFNPIPQEVLKISLEISNVSGVLIDSLNYIIIEESEKRGALVVDINKAFTNQLDMAQFNLNPFAGTLSLDIIHPNIEGHKLIAEQNFESFVKYAKNNY